MRFPSSRDFNFVVKVNQELIGQVVDIPVVIYKLHQELTRTNSYGEGTNKVWYVGVAVTALSAQEAIAATEENTSVDVTQAIEFSFLRQTLADANVYPERGDIIDWRSRYYEIDNTDDSEFFGGRPEFNLSIICKAHLTRKSNLQFEKPNL